MKPRTRALTAGALAATLVAAVLGATGGSAQADTEPVSGPGFLAAPTIVGPDDTGVAYPHLVRKTVTLNWNAVAGATAYRVEVGTDSTWSGTADYTTDVVFSQATLPLWLPNATYYWRVAALNSGNVGHWSSETGQAHSDANFVKGWRQVPVLSSVTTPFTGVPSFSWSPVPEASGYELQMSKDPTFGAQGTSTAPTPDTTPTAGTDTQATTQPDFLLADCLTARTRYTPAQDVVGASDSVGPCTFNIPADSTPVFWRVRALDAYTDSGAGSSTVPNAKEGVSYQGQWNPDQPPDLTSGCPTKPTAASPSPSATASAGPKPLLLACDPSRASIKGPWSPTQDFTYDGSAAPATGPAQIATASLASDDDALCTVTNTGSDEAEHAQCTDVPTLHWQPVLNATGYRVVIGRDDAFSNISFEMETPALQWTPTGSWADGLYYYAVQPCFGTTSCGSVTTTPPSFTKLTPRPVGLSTPPVMGEFTFNWQSYAASLGTASGQAETQDAYAYRLEVAPSSHPYFDSRVLDVVVDHAFYTPTDPMPDGTFLYRVQPLDSHGNALPWSLTKAFTRDATPPRIVSVSPSSGVTVLQGLKVVFSEPLKPSTLSTGMLSVSPAQGVTTTNLGDDKSFTLSPTTHWLPGATYTINVATTVTDLAGNAAVAVGPSFTVNTYVDDRSAAVSYTGVWKLLSASNALSGTYHGSTPTTSAQTTASLVFRGTGVYVNVCMGPANGYLDVYMDGVKKQRVSLYRSFSGCALRVSSLVGLARGQHTVRVVGVGVRPAGSSGTSVALDAFQVLP